MTVEVSCCLSLSSSSRPFSGNSCSLIHGAAVRLVSLPCERCDD
jgi:hypothetical protein